MSYIFKNPNTAITVAKGGTGLATLTTGNVILGAGTSNVTFVAPGTSGNVLTSNGSTWVSSAPASGGITTLNTLTAATQTFATGTSGSDFAISSSTSTHTFNLPTASATNRGALSSADWTTFNSKAPALSGTSGNLTKWTGSSTVGNSVWTEDANGHHLVDLSGVTSDTVSPFKITTPKISSTFSTNLGIARTYISTSGTLPNTGGSYIYERSIYDNTGPTSAAVAVYGKYLELKGTSSTNTGSGYYNEWKETTTGNTAAPINTLNGTGNYGLYAQTRVSTSTASAGNLSVLGLAARGNFGIGVHGQASDCAGSTAKGVGVRGTASGGTATYTTQIGVLGAIGTTDNSTLHDILPAFKAGGVFSNTNTSLAIIIGLDAGTEAFKVDTGGVVKLGATSTTPKHILNSDSYTNGADVLTLLNGPTGKAGDPAGYIKITVNGTDRAIPFW